MSSSWLTSREFWQQVGERALKTVAQAFLAMTAAQVIFDAFKADWQTMAGVSLGAGLISVATSIVSAEIGKKGSPSLVGSE